MGEVIRTAPERIYLITGDECPRDANFADLSEVTWCEDDVGGGIEYVRADLAEAKLRAELERRVPDVSAMARVLSDRAADACNIDCDDNWAMYGQEYIDDVQAMLAAAPSAPKADDPVKVQMLEALDTARDYVYSELENRKSALAGHPNKWEKEERDLAQVDAAIAAARKGEVE